MDNPGKVILVPDWAKTIISESMELGQKHNWSLQDIDDYMYCHLMHEGSVYCTDATESQLECMVESMMYCNERKQEAFERAETAWHASESYSC